MVCIVRRVERRLTAQIVGGTAPSGALTTPHPLLF